MSVALTTLQSPRAWFVKFSTRFQELNMTLSEVDHSMFYRHSIPNICIYLGVYVDISLSHTMIKMVSLIKPTSLSAFPD